MLLSLGHDGLLPKVFTRTSRRTNAPDIAIWAVAIPMTVIPGAYIMAGSTDTVLTSEVGTLATYGFMLAYALVSLAAPVFLAKRRTPKPLALVLGILGAVIMLFVFYVNWIPQLIPNDVFAALGWPLWALPYVFLAWTAVGIAWYQVIRRTRPDVINNAGRWGELSSVPGPARAPDAT
jgi:amino acid transporter